METQHLFFDNISPFMLKEFELRVKYGYFDAHIQSEKNNYKNNSNIKFISKYEINKRNEASIYTYMFDKNQQIEFHFSIHLKQRYNKNSPLHIVNKSNGTRKVKKIRVNRNRNTNTLKLSLGTNKISSTRNISQPAKMYSQYILNVINKYMNSNDDLSLLNNPFFDHNTEILTVFTKSNPGVSIQKF